MKYLVGTSLMIESKQSTRKHFKCLSCINTRCSTGTWYQVYSIQYTLFAISLVLSVKKRKKEKTFLAACIRLYYIALANRHRNHFGQTPKHFEPEMGENGKVVTLEISSQLLELYASIKRRTFAFRTMHNSKIVFHHQ